jgi:glucan biosynthesis protein C
MERVAFLDYLRISANFLRLFIHAGVPYMVSVSPIWPVDDHGLLWIDFLIFLGHLFVMELFFMLSGYLFSIQLESMSLREILKNRFRRIVLPFVFGMLLMVPFVLMLFGLAKQSGNEWLGRQEVYRAFQDGLQLGLKNFFPTAHLWFLYYLIGFYAITIVIPKNSIRSLMRKIPPKQFFAAAYFLSFLCLLFTKRWMIENPLTLFPEISSFLHFLLFFFSGMLAHKQASRNHLLAPGKLIIAGLIFGLISAACQLKFGKTADPWYGQIKILACVTYAGGSWMLSIGSWYFFQHRFRKSSPFIRWLAGGSYWIYLLSLPIVMFSHLLLRTYDFPVWQKLMLVFLLGGGIPLLLYTFKKKMDKSKISA